MTKSADEHYLHLLAQKGKSFHKLKDIFQHLGGFYNGTGYAFPSTSNEEVEKIACELGVKLYQIPLEGQTFEEYKASEKAAYRKQQQISKGIELSTIQYSHGIDEMSEEAIISSDLPEDVKEHILSLLKDQDKLEWSENIEKVRVSTKPNKKNAEIKFICDLGDHWLSEEPPKKEMLLYYYHAQDPRGFLPRGIVGMIAGPGGVGKSHLMTQIAISISSGVPLFDKFHPKKSGSVFLGMGENSMDDLRRIVWKSTQHLSQENKNSVIKHLAPFSFHGQNVAFIENGKPSEYYFRLKEELTKKAPENGWDLLIFDPASRLMGVDAEKDNALATLFISLLEALTEDLPGCPTVLFAHHVNKGAINQQEQQNQSAARGASALTDGCRWQLNFFKKEREDNKYNLTMVKTNFTAMIESLILEKNCKGELKELKQVVVK